MSSKMKKVCVIGAGPSGMSVVYQFNNMEGGSDVDIVCYEKQSAWGGLWNFTWRTGRLTRKSKVDLTKYVRFCTVVRHVEYCDADDTFTVEVTDLKTNTSSRESFTYVVVATGIFHTPNVPSFDGIESFEGRILHAKELRNAIEFKGQRVLIIGASYSAEDIAPQCAKFGAKSVICTWRTKPMDLKWPKEIEERPLIQKFDGNIAYFKDDSKAEVDAVILCTGYLYSFPFIEERLRLKSSLSLYPKNLYKGTFWIHSGNNKVFYLGVQDQFFTFTMFDVQALWICKCILGRLQNEPKALQEMKTCVQQCVEKYSRIKSFNDQLDFQTEFVRDFCVETGYPLKVTKTRDIILIWQKHKADNLLSYRDQTFSSIFTENMSAKPDTTWWHKFDDSIAYFVNGLEN